MGGTAAAKRPRLVVPEPNYASDSVEEEAEEEEKAIKKKTEIASRRTQQGQRHCHGCCHAVTDTDESINGSRQVQTWQFNQERSQTARTVDIRIVF